MFEADFCAAEIFSEIDVDRALAGVLFRDIVGATKRVTQQGVLNKTFKTDAELELGRR